MKQPNRFVLFLLCSLWLLGLLWGASGPSPTVHAQLPPRPTLTPTATTGAEEPVRIRLHAQSDYANLWSIVQWQGGGGEWNDVEGWLGQIETPADGRLGKQWRVLPKDYGSGPFRWVILDEPGGQIVAVSAPFHLPDPVAPLGVVEGLTPAGTE